MRGIIITSEYSGTKDNLQLCGGVNPSKLREYLLYWDKIDYPTNNVIYTGLSPDEKYLEEVGVLKRTNTIITGNFMINPEIVIKSQLATLEINSKNTGEIWSIAQPTKKIILPSNESIRERNIQVELYDCIPVPSANVNLEDILNFKEHRYDELREFRLLLDEMYESIVNSSDIDFTKNKCIGRLQNKVIDIHKIMDESRIKKFLSSVKVELNISELIKSSLMAYAGYEIGSKIGFPTAGAVVGLASSTINLKSEFSLKPNFIPDDMRDYAYLFYANRDLI